MGNTPSPSANEEASHPLIDVVLPEPPLDQSSSALTSASPITSTAVVNTDVHLRPDSVGLEADAESPNIYNLRFVLDCKVETWVCIYLFAEESLDANGLNTQYHVSSRSGVDQIAVKINPEFNVVFEHPDAAINISQYTELELTAAGTPPYPFVIELKPIYSDNRPSQTHTTFVSMAKERESFEAKVVKQKFQIGSRVYRIHEMFGLQQQANNIGEEESTECVICMTVARNTAVVPCLHLCLCIECANILRSQPNSRCPMCRTSVESLIALN